MERHDTVFTDAQNHASIVDGIRLSRAKRVKFRHCDIDDLARRLRISPGQRSAQKFLVTESLFSMDGDFAPLADYAQLCRETGTVLIVDEAHAVGVYGSRGSGWIEQTGMRQRGFSFRGYSRQSARRFRRVRLRTRVGDGLFDPARAALHVFDGSASRLAAALDASLSVIEDEPERRRACPGSQRRLASRHWRNAASISADSESQIIPIILGDNERAKSAAAELAAAKDSTCARSGRRPFHPALPGLRVSVNANLDEGILRTICQLPYNESLHVPRSLHNRDRHRCWQDDRCRGADASLPRASDL